ncbi:uncharacterized protein (DUF1330 family) [Catenulispora sp. GP43]|uniref:DUF1330 domain-containing protein n=1 Tax=Catenulispora sp. GP43 TaxID=3156263 RepID=UPI003518B940
MPAYSITEVETIDREAAREYVRLARAAVGHFGGRYLVLAASPTAAEGEWSGNRRLVVIEFADMATLRTWYDSVEYAPARALASKALRRRLLFVEGYDAQQQTGE